MVQTEYGGAPKGGWSKLVCELFVEDIDESCAFWCEILGFSIAYHRPEEKFVFLERPEGAQIMLCERTGVWDTGPMSRPFGRGVMFQIYIEHLDEACEKLIGAKWRINSGPREVWRRWGDREGGKREITVQDPDGYLIMLAEDLGERGIGKK